MTQGTNGTALETALVYFHAWSARDLDATMDLVADDIVCDAPAGSVAGKEAFRHFWAGFMKMLKGARLIAAHGDGRSVVMLYETDTIPVPWAPVGEHLTIENGKIVKSRLVFDRLAYVEAQAKAA